MALSVYCRLVGSRYTPEIEEKAGTYILKGGLTDKNGHPIDVGEFRIPKDVTQVELHADPDDFYLVEIRPIRGWLNSMSGEPSREIQVASS
jgi:hypothetical protein